MRACFHSGAAVDGSRYRGARCRGGGVIMMGRMSRVFALLGVVLWLMSSGEALGAARVALVVGNGDYAAEIGKLKNPTSDAQLMASTLTGLGFEVALVTDADQKAMKRA